MRSDFNDLDRAERIWRQAVGEGPLVATAIHDGHAVRQEVLVHLALDEASRLREEDPFTGRWTDVAPTRIVGLRSRFEVDLNRPRDKAIYRRPADAWGLQVWKQELPNEVVSQSLAEYDAFYAAMHELFSSIQRRYGALVVLDLHSYNHRRGGPGAAPADPALNPQVNIGTGTMDRERFGPIVDRLVADLRAFEFPGGRLDVRENVKFLGGNFAAWIHQTFPGSGCALAIEFKKFFMDEWTGQADANMVESVFRALQSTVSGVLETLRAL